MSPFAVEVHSLAADEAEAAERWYRERNETASIRFRHELERAVELTSVALDGPHWTMSATAS